MSSHRPVVDSEIAIRYGRPEDQHALAALAQLDEATPLSGDVLVAQRDGRVIAALALDSGHAIADPFERTAEAVAMLRVLYDGHRRTELRARRPRLRIRIPRPAIAV